MVTEKKLIDILKSHKLRITPVRKEVLSLFIENDVAISHQDIEKSILDIDRITLYRTLKSFEEKGVIHKAVDGTDTSKYALCEAKCDEGHHHDDHVHFHCEDCGNTFCVDDIEVPRMESPQGYSIRSTHVILSGKCKKCH